MRKTRIFLIEDNRILRDGIKALINAQTDLKIVAATEGNHDTLPQARSLKPQVVLIDLGLRSANGLHVVTTMTRELPHTKVIGMGLIPSQQDIVEFVEAGAAGFILKDATIEDVLGTIRAVARGMKNPSPSADGIAFHSRCRLCASEGEGKLTGAVRMTKREREIIVLIAEAMSNKEIAQRLNLSTIHCEEPRPQYPGKDGTPQSPGNRDTFLRKQGSLSSLARFSTLNKITSLFPYLLPMPCQRQENPPSGD